MVQFAIEVRCDTCPDQARCQLYDRIPTPDDLRMVAAGWDLLSFADGRIRAQCPDCAASATAPAGRGRRAGFTLVELLVVLAIIGIIAAVALPVVMTARESQRVDSAAQLVQGATIEAAARAQTKDAGGFRLLPDATLITRRADGSIDPDAPLAFDRIQQLEQPPGYAEGRVAIYTATGSYPTADGFAPTAGVLCLEQEPRDRPARLRDGTIIVPYNTPTAWAWNVRLGDKVELGNHLYTVVGPTAVGPADGNVERFVNYDPAWAAIDRDGDGVKAEFLYLTNGQDDDGDGYADNGFDGVDNNYDGVIDDAGERSDPERWLDGVKDGVRQGTYTLRRRPVPIASGVLPLAGAVIDATGWASATPGRSRVPVDPWTGTVDVMVDASGRWTPIRSVGVPSADGLKNRWYHLWLANREDVDAPAEQAGSARLLTIDARSGRTSIVEADAKDPAAARAEAEGRGR